MTEARASKPVLELKGRMVTLTILRPLTSSVEALAREIDRRVQEAPGLFRHLPVIVDVAEVAGSDLHVDLPGFVELLRTRSLVPIGIRGGDSRWREAAHAAGLPVFAPERTAQERKSAGPAERAGAPSPQSDAKEGRRTAKNGEGAAAVGSGGMLVTQPVRSGQQIYARGTDLIVLTAVSPGAEVLADGHIHVYGTLNGRALAGVRGNTNARIFCKSFRAELVSIAGIYGVSEQFEEGLAGKPAQVSLSGDTLQIERL